MPLTPLPPMPGIPAQPMPVGAPFAPPPPQPNLSHAYLMAAMGLLNGNGIQAYNPAAPDPTLGAGVNTQFPNNSVYGIMQNLQAQQAGAPNQATVDAAKQHAVLQGLQAQQGLVNSLRPDPSAAEYNPQPMTAPPYPTLQMPATPQYHVQHADPWSTGMAALAGLLVPEAAGILGTFPQQAVQQNAATQYGVDTANYKLNAQNALANYEGQIGARKDQMQLGEINQERQLQGQRLLASDTDRYVSALAPLMGKEAESTAMGQSDMQLAPEFAKAQQAGDMMGLISLYSKAQTSGSLTDAKTYQDDLTQRLGVIKNAIDLAQKQGDSTTADYFKGVGLQLQQMSDLGRLKLGEDGIAASNARSNNTLRMEEWKQFGNIDPMTDKRLTPLWKTRQMSQQWLNSSITNANNHYNSYAMNSLNGPTFLKENPNKQAWIDAQPDVAMRQQELAATTRDYQNMLRTLYPKAKNLLIPTTPSAQPGVGTFAGNYK